MHSCKTYIKRKYTSNLKKKIYLKIKIKLCTLLCNFLTKIYPIEREHGNTYYKTQDNNWLLLQRKIHVHVKILLTDKLRKNPQAQLDHMTGYT